MGNLLIILFGIAFIIIMSILVWVLYSMKKDLINSRREPPFSPELSERINQQKVMGDELLELVGSINQREREKEMTAYADMKRKEHEKPYDMQVGGHEGDEWIRDTKHKRAEILIPQQMSAEDKQILRDFYDL